MVGNYNLHDFKRDPDMNRVMDALLNGVEDCLWKLFESKGVIRSGMSRQAALDAARSFCERVGLVPEISYQHDLVDNTVIHVTAGFRAVEIAAKEPTPAAPCEQCGGSKVDIGYDDMGTPVESPCKKCLP